MAKGTLKNRVLDDARNKALRMSQIPDRIKASYDASIRDGYVILTKKKSSHAGSGKSAG